MSLREAAILIMSHYKDGFIDFEDAIELLIEQTPSYEGLTRFGAIDLLNNPR